VRTKSGQKQVFNDGVIARFRPNGEAFEIIGEGMNNIWAWSLDRFGRTFIHEANDLGYSQAAFERDATYPSFLPTMSRSKLIHPPTAEGLGLGGSGFCGIASAGDSADGFPEDWRYRNFVANPITGEINSVSYSIDDLGNPTFKRLENLVTCSDKMFRPVNVTFGPDGCLYVADWYDRTIVHGTSVKNPEVNDRTSGRIWRIRHESQPAYQHVNVKASANHELVAHLSSGNLWRMRAACHQIEFRQATELIPSLTAFIRDPKTTDSGRIHAVWALESLKHYDAGLWRLLLASSSQHVRYEAVRALSSIQPSLKDVLAPLQALLKEEKSYYVINELVRFFRDTPQTLAAEDKALLMQLRTPEAGLPSAKVKGWKGPYHALGGAYEKRFLNQLIDSVGKEKTVTAAFDTGKWDSVIEMAAPDTDNAKLDKTIARLSKAYAKPGSAGDRSLGEIQYKARCATCHDIGIAPPINSGGAKPSLEILTAVFKPDEAIEPAFRAYRIVKKDGTTLEGFRSDATKNGIELTFMGGGKLLVPTSEIEKSGYLDGKSFMSGGMADGMTDQQMIDLLHYLGAGK
jgi:putative heme-binding domain-containing protein